MSQKSNESSAHLSQIEALIAALKRERERLERRFILLHRKQKLLNDFSRYYFNLWRLKSETGLNVLELSPGQRRLLQYTLGDDILEDHLQTIEDELHPLVNQGRYLTFAEIQGISQTIVTLIERLESQKEQISKQKRSAWKTVKILASKVTRVSGGVALIVVDLQIQNWPSVIGGAILVLTTPLNDK